MEKLKKITTDELLQIKFNLTQAEYMLKNGQIDPMGAFSTVLLRGVK